MSETRTPPHARAAGPWTIDTRELARQPGASRRYHRGASFTTDLDLAGVIAVRADSEVELDVLCESAGEGIWVSGTASTTARGECVRCLDPVTEPVEVEVSELFAYPDTATEATTDTDEVSRLVDDLIDLEPTVRDSVVLALPHAPLCREDCAGMCVDCGRKWADLEPGHRHETIDPRWDGLRERFGSTGGNPT